ncbi:MAG TPA: iron chelate uptake ABC transporter family permease subunit [Longimicrobiaceae bacterium]
MKPAARLLLLLAALCAAFLLAVRLGAVTLEPGEIARALTGRGDATAAAIVREIRLPRAVLAALVGAALAASGATFQALLRNPLAEPYILGVSGGAALGAVLAIVLGVAATAWGLPLAAFAGAAAAILLVLRIAVSVGRTLDTRILLLAGVVAAAFFNACILLALTFADAESFRSAVFWMMGSLSGATWGASAILALYLLPGLAVLIALARPLDLLSIGEETAAHLGVRVEQSKYLAYGVASLLTAASVAVGGVIGFAGLIVPHVVRMLWGSGHRFLIPASALLGATFLVLTDTLARTVAAPVELPIGVITAFLGVPFFLWVLKRSDARRDVGASSSHAPRSAPPTSSSNAPLRPPSSDEGSRPAAGSTAPVACEVSGLTFGYPDAPAPAVHDVALHVELGRVTCLLGPNGSGKSTLLRLLLGTLRADRGRVEILGRDLTQWPRRELARKVGVVQQHEEIAFPITARDLVALGRFPRLGHWRAEGDADRRAIARAMELCDVSTFAPRAVQTLSGGERQRVRIARALAQEPEILVLDEPTVALDIRHEMEIFELLRRLAGNGVAVLIVTHNLNLAARYADRLALLHQGSLVAAGPPTTVLTRELVEMVYQWPVRVDPHPGPGPDCGAPQVAPLSRH